MFYKVCGLVNFVILFLAFLGVADSESWMELFKYSLCVIVCFINVNICCKELGVFDENNY